MLVGRVFLACALFGSSAIGQVFTVDAGGSGDFLTVQEAVDAAKGGETILVKPGSYPILGNVITVTGISVVLLADGGPVQIPPLSISEVPASSRVVVQGFSFGDPLLPAVPAVSLANNAGSIWIEDCTGMGAAGTTGFACLPGTDGMAGVKAEDCDALNLVNCQFRGGNGADFTVTPGGDGLVAVGSLVAVYGSLLEGGDGGQFQDVCGGALLGDGGAGIRTQNSQVFLGGSQSLGGEAGDGIGGDGGCVSADATLQYFDTGFVAGAGGVDLRSMGATEEFLGLARQLSIDSPVREQEAATLRFQGAVGDRVLLFATLAARQTPWPKTSGWLLLSFPLAPRVFTGMVSDPSGTLDIPATIPLLLEPADGSLVFYTQAFFSDASGLTLSNPCGLVVLDESD